MNKLLFSFFSNQGKLQTCILYVDSFKKQKNEIMYIGKCKCFVFNLTLNQSLFFNFLLSNVFETSKLAQDFVLETCTLYASEKLL